jgi:hypothetical protein
MLELESVGPVTKIKLARALFGRSFYFTTAYWVDGLLIDTGCAYTEGEIMQALEGLPVRPRTTDCLRYIGSFLR